LKVSVSYAIASNEKRTSLRPAVRKLGMRQFEALKLPGIFSGKSILLGMRLDCRFSVFKTVATSWHCRSMPHTSGSEVQTSMT